MAQHHDHLYPKDVPKVLFFLLSLLALLPPLLNHLPTHFAVFAQPVEPDVASEAVQEDSGQEEEKP